jgi:predicted MFS family arabinose efflux permease
MPDAPTTERRPAPEKAGAYSRLLRIPGAARFSAAGWFGRFPKSTLTLAAVLLVYQATGGYAVAGAVAGVMAIALAVSGPLWSRVMDTRGQRFALAVSVPALTLSAAGFALAVLSSAPVALWFVLAATTGAAVADVPSAVRARWTSLLDEGPSRHSAFSLESVLDEAVFVVAPPVLTAVAAAVSPVLGLALVIVLGAGGSLVLLLDRRTAPPVASARRSPAGPGAARARVPVELIGIVAVFVAIGAVFGAFDLTAVGFARAEAMPAAGGLLLAAIGGGSVVFGLVYGMLRPRGSTRGRFVTASLACALIVPVLLVPVGSGGTALWITALAAFAAGVAISPLLISGQSLVQELSPPERMTEALAWPPTGMSVGVTIGAAAAGAAVDAFGARAGFAVSAVAALAGLAFAAADAAVATARRRQLPR